jgi:hypothetical protein
MRGKARSARGIVELDHVIIFLDMNPKLLAKTLSAHIFAYSYAVFLQARLKPIFDQLLNQRLKLCITVSGGAFERIAK